MSDASNDADSLLEPLDNNHEAIIDHRWYASTYPWTVDMNTHEGEARGKGISHTSLDEFLR